MIDFKIERKHPRIELIPMIDIMFFMLVFFMLFATFKTAQTGVAVELPKTLHLGQTKQNTIVISFDKNKQLFFGKEMVQLDGLGDKVRNELRDDQTTIFIVKPDTSTSYGDLIRIIDVIAGAGVDKPLLGVERETSPKDK